MQQTFGRWVLEHDPDATRRCYARLAPGAGCDCCYCRNYDAAAGRTFPAEFIALAHALGVDLKKPAELGHPCREPSGLHMTTGWFHLVGSILTGDDVVHRNGNVGIFRYEVLAPGCDFGFSARLASVREAFEGLPLVQLEFTTRVPWVLNEPEPDIETGVA